MCVVTNLPVVSELKSRCIAKLVHRALERNQSFSISFPSLRVVCVSECMCGVCIHARMSVLVNVCECIHECVRVVFKRYTRE